MIELRVGGMSCGRCVGHVEAALRAVPGVTAVRVDLAAGRAEIEAPDEARAALLAAVAAAGYDGAPA